MLLSSVIDPATMAEVRLLCLVVEPIGIEPMTFCLQGKRSPN